MRKIVLVAAAGENNELGKDKDLVWHLPDDFRRFKKLTMGHPMIMGRKTFETFPDLLPGRKHIILTRQKDYHPKGTTVVHNVQEALEASGDDEFISVIGGGEIYKLFLEIANRIELTRVHGSFKADTFFPDFDPSLWKLSHSEFHPADERHQYAFTYLTYEKV